MKTKKILPQIDPNKIPDFATSKDLIEIGVFPDLQTSSVIMRNGYGPRHRLSDRRYLFLKPDVIAWLESLGRIVK